MKKHRIEQIRDDIVSSDLSFHIPHETRGNVTQLDDDVVEKVAQRVLSHGESISKAISVVVYKLD